MVEVVYHELDSLGIFGIHVPVNFLVVILVVTSRDVDDASLAFLKVALRIVATTAGKTKELRLGADNGFVDFVNVGAAGDGKIRVVAAFLEAVELVNMEFV